MLLYIFFYFFLIGKMNLFCPNNSDHAALRCQAAVDPPGAGPAGQQVPAVWIGIDHEHGCGPLGGECGHGQIYAKIVDSTTSRTRYKCIVQILRFVRFLNENISRFVLIMLSLQAIDNDADI